jgi:vacuolar-type H+-ATPase subunit D/Vma8
VSSTAGVKPTKGFLMDMKRRIGFIERGTEFLKLKRDQLAKELTTSLDVLKGRRRLLMDNLQQAYAALTAAYLSLGPQEVQSQAKSIKKALEL